MPSKREKSSVSSEELVTQITELKKKIQLSGKFTYYLIKIILYLVRIRCALKYIFNTNV